MHIVGRRAFKTALRDGCASLLEFVPPMLGRFPACGSNRVMSIVVCVQLLYAHVWLCVIVTGGGGTPEGAGAAAAAVAAAIATSPPPTFDLAHTTYIVDARCEGSMAEQASGERSDKGFSVFLCVWCPFF